MSRPLRRSFLALLLAVTPALHSCAFEPAAELEPRAASTVEQVGAELEEDGPPRERAEVAQGSGERLPWLDGSTLVRSDDAGASSLGLALEGGPPELMPDLSALERLGYELSLRGDTFSAPVYATTSRGDLYVLDHYRRGDEHGVVLVHARRGAEARVYPVPTGPVYATFPSQVVPLADGTVLLGISAVADGTFGDDFPGCPISIFHAQNRALLARFDGRRVEPVPFPGTGRLATVRAERDGTWIVETGWPEPPAGLDPSEVGERARWTRGAGGGWVRGAVL